MTRRSPSLMPVFDRPDPYLDSAKILEDSRNLVLAGALLAEAERQFPGHEPVSHLRTEFIERHHGPQAALARWVLMSNRFPEDERIWAKLVRQHREAGRLQSAEVVLAEGLAKAQQSKFLSAEGAVLAQARGDLDEAARRWRAGIERYPRWPEAVLVHNVIQSARAVRELDMALEQGAQPPDTDHLFLASSEQGGEQARALLSRFESLGEDFRFGFVQRYYGAGAPGLFKYARIAPANLVAALDKDLAEIIEARDAVLILQPRDWFVRVPRAGLEILTLLEPVDPDGFLVRMRRRLRHLAMKLLEDLREGSKIFVLKAHNLGDDEISALHAAVRRHGAGSLLCVRRAAEGHAPGSVEPRDNGLWVGHLPPGGLMDKFYRDVWIAICTAVAAAAPAGR